MIISHSRKFIFIKTTKTGGTSLELALSKYCGDGDVITPVLPHEEQMRAGIGGRAPQNYELPRREYDPVGLAKFLLLGRRRPPRFNEHDEAWRVRELVGPEIWNDYFTFTIVRHPFERVVSAFFFARTMIPELNLDDVYDLEDIDQFIRYRAGDINQNWRAYTVRDEVIVDHLVRLEKLEDDLAEVSRRIGLQHNLHEDMKGIRAKSEYRPKGARSRDILTDRHKAVIEALCEKEMVLCGYSGDAAKQDRRIA